MTLDVLVSTFGRGVLRAAGVLTPPREDVMYTVSFQYEDEEDAALVPAALSEREDVKVVRLKGRGLSANRNSAVAASSGDIMVFADDDNLYTWDGFDRILRAFRETPDADIICFRSAGYDGKPVKSFPKKPFSLSRMPRGYYVSSVEIAARRESRLPLFDERFGLGAEYLASGEEDIFIHDALRRGLNVVYRPETIVRTDPASTGTKFNSLASVRRSKGAVLAALHGPGQACLRAAKFALCHVNGIPRLTAMKDMCEGIAYARKIGRCSFL